MRNLEIAIITTVISFYTDALSEASLNKLCLCGRHDEISSPRFEHLSDGERGKFILVLDFELLLG